LKTGKRGRPKKMYQSKTKPSVPQSIPQMFETDEKEARLEAMKKEYDTLQENGT
jgi:hypothetical protein